MNKEKRLEICKEMNLREFLDLLGDVTTEFKLDGNEEWHDKAQDMYTKFYCNYNQFIDNADLQKQGCDHCSDFQEGLYKEKRYNFMKSTHELQNVNSNVWGLRIYETNGSFYLINDKTSVPINYCPMCGRNLGE